MTKKLKKFTIDDYKLNEAYNKMLLWFFSYPTKEMSLSDLSHQLKISKTTANRVVEQLIHEGFLEREVLGRIWRLRCVQDHVFTYSKKIAFNLQNIYETGILNLIHEKIPNNRCIILFGSYRKGDDDQDSDIDIAVEVLGDADLEIIPLGTFPQYGYRRNVSVNIHVFSRNNIEMNLFTNIANGIVLDGILEVRP